jgi:hypothetical protein
MPGSFPDINFMSITPTSSATAAQTSILQQLKADYQELQQSINGNNLAGAQTAYAAIQKLENQNEPAGTTNSATPNPLAAVGQALSQGNLQGAKSALQQLQSKSHHHHHHSSGTSSSSSGNSLSTGNTPGSLNIQA